MSFDSIFRNKLSRPSTRPMLAGGGGERSIVWSSSDTGLLKRLEALELEVAQLRSRVSPPKYYPPVDLDPDPGVAATTGYELASDGTLRAYVEVTVSGTGLYEVALLGAPEIVYATKDAYVDEANPATVSGTGSVLIAGCEGDGHAFRTWLQFDWGTWPDGLWQADPMLAEVRLAKLGSNDDAIELSLDYEDLSGGDWDESTLTWNNQPDLGRSVTSLLNTTGTDYNWFEARNLFYLLREVKSGSWTGTPYGMAVVADRESEDVGLVDWISLEGAATDDEKPQLWYWGQAEKSQLMGGTVKTSRLYGKPGGTYYLVHRMLSKDNVPGRWSDPVEITLPSEGATPSKPAAATKTDTLISHLKIISLTTSVPTDFSHYHVYIKETNEPAVTEFNTRVDRFQHWFPFDYAHGGDYEVKYKIVTRSGVESDYSNNLSFSVTSNLKLQSPNGDAWLSLIDSSGLGATVLQLAGNVADFIVSGDDGDYTVRTDKVKTITHDNILHSCGQATNDSSQSTTSTSWTDRTTGSITLTPPGTGNAYYLLIGKFTLFKDGANEIKVTFKVDGTETNSEEGYSASGAAETLTIGRRVAVTAGSSHTFKLCFKSGDGGSATVYRSNIIAIHLGNY
jgi:hypothetical protein